MSQSIAKHLLDIRAVFLQPNDPFTWSSGMKAPIYCDNRLTMSYPDVRRKIAEGLAELIKTKFPETELIAGTATAGIPHAAWISDILELPMCYVRSKAKSHGKGNQIEGKASQGQKVVVVEDLISTGGSSIVAVKALKEAGCDVLGVVSIFSYELDKAKTAFDEEGVKAFSLTGYSDLIETAFENNLIKEEDLATLRSWRENPEDWGK
ncbi:orotate phosphoribosyltransferase [Bacillus norwichensis]|uniref:Orotate phosphoribosyltransferase n=1 Tax=Bacillus norwichensis TaxID=2762217 RepID=A0ABR8VGR1_9BACI|nr:orotate phosphoribosyltransferase [Bacillus norwichensis]MBD8003961.1 orotate phosphoribosyltransferase [Bacillus norwichensis]